VKYKHEITSQREVRFLTKLLLENKGIGSKYESSDIRVTSDARATLKSSYTYLKLLLPVLAYKSTQRRWNI